MIKNFFKRFYLVLICVILYAPIITLMVLSFNSSKSRSKWGGFTTKWYVELFKNNSIMNALYTTLIIALLSALIATILGTAAAIGIQAMRKKMRTVVTGVTNIPMLNADIVTGIALMLWFSRFTNLGYVSILLAHITFNIPYVILSVLPKLKQTNRYTYEAALDLGASPVKAFFKVVFPDIVPGVFSGFMLAFTMSLDDFVITHFTRGAGINTLSTLIYSQVKIGVRPTLYALSTVIFITVLLVLVIVNFLSGSRRGKGDYYSHKGGITTKKAIVLALVFLVCVLGLNRYAGSLVGAQDQGQVYVYCFGDYIDPELVDKFEEDLKKVFGDDSIKVVSPDNTELINIEFVSALKVSVQDINEGKAIIKANVSGPAVSPNLIKYSIKEEDSKYQIDNDGKLTVKKGQTAAEGDKFTVKASYGNAVAEQEFTVGA